MPAQRYSVPRLPAAECLSVQSAQSPGAPNARAADWRLRLILPASNSPSESGARSASGRRLARDALLSRAAAPSLGPKANWIHWRMQSALQGPPLPGAPAAPGEYRPQFGGSNAPRGRPTFRPCPDRAFVIPPGSLPSHHLLEPRRRLASAVPARANNAPLVASLPCRQILSAHTRRCPATETESPAALRQ